MPDDARPVPGPPRPLVPPRTPGSSPVPGRPTAPAASSPAGPRPSVMPARRPAPERDVPVEDSASVAELRRASAAVEALEGEDFDPGAHAERFEAVHDALVAVLADIDRG